jgi:RNA polymerase sigma-70 factor (ECF subfamily)
MANATTTVQRSDWSTLSDEDVVARVLTGETALYEILLRRYNQRVFRVARSVLRDDVEAEDVMQQAYVDAYAHLSQFAGQARFSTWLTRIAFHEALARLKRRRREGSLRAAPQPDGDPMEMVRSSAPSPEEQALHGELRGHLEAAIDALPTTYRTAFVMREVEGLSTSETAACLGKSEDVVKTRLHRARALLREELYRRAGANAASAFGFQGARCDRVVAAVFERLRLGRPVTLQ